MSRLQRTDGCMDGGSWIAGNFRGLVFQFTRTIIRQVMQVLLVGQRPPLKTERTRCKSWLASLKRVSESPQATNFGKNL